MSGLTPPPASELDADFLAQLAELPVPDALSQLFSQDLAHPDTVVTLATAALEAVESNPDHARQWLDIGSALRLRLADNATGQGHLDYAQARFYAQRGQWGLAEAAIRAAQQAWQAPEDQVWLARTYLGLTQILTMQGRYDEAETTSQQAITHWEALAATEPAFNLQLINAVRNRANLLSFQERHVAALTEYERARQLVDDQIAANADQPELLEELNYLLAQIHFNQAVAYLYLDRVFEAEAVLQDAASRFEQVGDLLYRGRTRSNLGSLYLQTGRYSAALSQFDSAARDLIGDEVLTPDIDADRLRLADILLLDRASVYLALNLLPEAALALGHCETLFRTANQPLELGQTLLSLGTLHLRNGALAEAEAALQEAERLFRGLNNHFWLNRSLVALAAMLYQQGEVTEAATRLDQLLTQFQSGTDVVTWDTASLIDAQILRLRLHLEHQEVEAARTLGYAAATRLGISLRDPAEVATAELNWPQLVMRLQHALGQLERSAGNPQRAQAHLRAAISLLERQRSSLPVEEIRTAFLDDKSSLYSDLVMSLLEDPEADGVVVAFAMVERARSRALLERLLVTISGEVTDEADAVAQRRAELEQQLKLLHNRLLGESGSRYVQPEVNEAIRTYEAALEQLAWQRPHNLPEAEPVDLPALQQALADDQQAVVYYIAEQEVMAFVVTRSDVQLFRRLCSQSQLEEAASEWQFQLGRAELSPAQFARHAERFERGWRAALARLYQLLIEPLRVALHAPRLLIIPYGVLHLLPFHAFYQGSDPLLTWFECTYAASASLAVRTLTQPQCADTYQTWSGLALTDSAIPGARQEVQMAAAHFAQHQLYLDEQANWAGLQAAARQSDILHIATHGLFRPDNPFFSMLKLADGWIDVRALYRLPLAARMVILSACESGASQVRGGDEVIGLARGFLAHGIQTLLVSLWNVHDASSTLLMEQFYTHLTATVNPVRPAAALRAAQQVAQQSGLHPYFWAPYLIIGA